MRHHPAQGFVDFFAARSIEHLSLAADRSRQLPASGSTQRAPPAVQAAATRGHGHRKAQGADAQPGLWPGDGKGGGGLQKGGSGRAIEVRPAALELPAPCCFCLSVCRDAQKKGDLRYRAPCPVPCRRHPPAATRRRALQELLAAEAVAKAGPSYAQVDVDDLLDDPDLERLHAERLAAMQREAEKRAAMQRKGHGASSLVAEGSVVLEVTTNRANRWQH